MDAAYHIDLISEFAFGVICHQNPESLMTIEGKSLMLCPRCVGLQVGAFLGFSLFAAVKIQRLDLGQKVIRYILILTLLTLAGHWVAGKFMLIQDDTIGRLITGSFAGTLMGMMALWYRRRIIPPLRPGSSHLSPINLLSYLAVSIGLLGLLVFVDNWLFLTVCVLISLAGNTFIVIEILIRRGLKFR